MQNEYSSIKDPGEDEPLPLLELRPLPPPPPREARQEGLVTWATCGHPGLLLAIQVPTLMFAGLFAAFAEDSPCGQPMYLWITVSLLLNTCDSIKAVLSIRAVHPSRVWDFLKLGVVPIIMLIAMAFVVVWGATLAARSMHYQSPDPVCVNVTNPTDAILALCWPCGGGGPTTEDGSRFLAGRSGLWILLCAMTVFQAILFLIFAVECITQLCRTCLTSMRRRALVRYRTQPPHSAVQYELIPLVEV